MYSRGFTVMENFSQGHKVMVEDHGLNPEIINIKAESVFIGYSTKWTVHVPIFRPKNRKQKVNFKWVILIVIMEG